MPQWGAEVHVKMLGADVVFRTGGTSPADAEKRLLQIMERAHDLRVPFEAWRPDLLAQSTAVFNAEGLPEPWPALDPGYAAWKSRVAPGKTIGRLTDRMFESFTVPGGADAIWEVEPQAIRYGSEVPYWGHFAAKRPILAIMQETADLLVGKVVTYLMAGETGEEGMATVPAEAIPGPGGEA